mgnify:CR=1 FL=1
MRYIDRNSDRDREQRETKSRKRQREKERERKERYRKRIRKMTEKKQKRLPYHCDLFDFEPKVDVLNVERDCA